MTGMVRASGTSYGDEPLHSRYEEPSSDMTRQLFAPLNALGLQSYMAAGAALLNTHKLFHPKHMSGLRAARDFSLPRQKTALGVQGGEEEETQPAWCCQDAKVTAWSRCSFHQ
ncbi:uncharacterized protein LOC102564541 [Alligator mississippiensis]|uniref:uncharacterized protein LOC102564541 n=1 Tax=Alligator mississippiensis TaxID=8496 RepID=UPI0028779E95|nr:uncharacterized protein LOC102564541 [Alligator mississippiensis]